MIGAPVGNGIGKGHPLLAGKLRPMGTTNYPVFKNPKGIIRDIFDNVYLIGANGYNFRNFFIGPNAIRRDVQNAWAFEANGPAMLEWQSDNESIYSLNGWDDIASIPDSRKDKIGGDIVIPSTTGGPPVIVPYHTHASQLADPYVITKDQSSWFPLSDPSQHNPTDDQRDLISGALAPMPQATVDTLNNLFSGHLTTTDGRIPCWKLRISRWSRLAYIEGTNVVQLAGVVIDTDHFFLAWTGATKTKGDAISILLSVVTGLATAIQSTVQLDDALKQQEGIIKESVADTAKKETGDIVRGGGSVTPESDLQLPESLKDDTTLALALAAGAGILLALFL